MIEIDQSSIEEHVNQGSKDILWMTILKVVIAVVNHNEHCHIGKPLKQFYSTKNAKQILLLNTISILI